MDPEIRTTQKAVDLVIAHWKEKFAHVLPDKPDLIVVPEVCDQPAGMGAKLAKANKYHHVRKNQVLAFFGKVAKENNCYIVYSSQREMSDGTWRNSSILLDRRGEIAAIYNKNHLVIEENTVGIAHIRGRQNVMTAFATAVGIAAATVAAIIKRP